MFSIDDKVALGTRLRRLGDLLHEEAKLIYAHYGVPLEPRWYPVYAELFAKRESTVSKLAAAVGYSHPSVSQLIKEMAEAGVVELTRDENDKRTTVVRLTEKGLSIAPGLAIQCQDVRNAVGALLEQMDTNLWEAVREAEQLFAQRPLTARVKEMEERRKGFQVELIDYETRFAEDFKRLNLEWITRYFKVEQPDLDALDYPEEKILEPGGQILLARWQDRIVGTCALLRMSDGGFELAKMAVSESARGNGVGWLLGKEALRRAKVLNAKRVYLESNTILEPAIRLYEKLGFVRVEGTSSPYARCNIQMELLL